MPPKKWDDESEEESSDESVGVQPVVARRKFDDEEDSEDVADNWEEEDDSEAEREKAKKAAAAKAAAEAEAAKNKMSKAQRVEEHREANRRRRAAEEEDESSEEDEADKRARLRKSEQDADLRHAQDLLGEVDIHPRARGSGAGKPIVVEDKKNPGQTIDLASVPLFKPTSKTDFEALSEALVPLLRASAARPHYALWISGFVKNICQDLPSTEIKKVGSQLTALSNEKMKEEKAQDKSGKKTKAAKTKTTLTANRDIGRGGADVTSYEDGLDDGDFM